MTTNDTGDGRPVIRCAMCKRPIDRSSVFHTCEPRDTSSTDDRPASEATAC